MLQKKGLEFVSKRIKDQYPVHQQELTKRRSRKKRSSHRSWRHRARVWVSRRSSYPQSNNEAVVGSLGAIDRRLESTKAVIIVESGASTQIVQVTNRQTVLQAISADWCCREIAASKIRVANDVVSNARAVRECFASTAGTSRCRIDRSRGSLSLGVYRATNSTWRISIARHRAEERAVGLDEIESFAASCCAAKVLTCLEIRDGCLLD